MFVLLPQCQMSSQINDLAQHCSWGHALVYKYITYKLQTRSTMPLNIFSGIVLRVCSLYVIYISYMCVLQVCVSGRL